MSSLSQEQIIFLGEVIKIKTPGRGDPNYRGEYQEVCYHYCEVRNAAKDCLRGDISFRKARERINAHLEESGVRLENAMG